MTKIRVLVVDDSAFMRKMVSDLLSTDPQIEVVDKARNGLECINKVKQLKPDVVTMDIEMPVMNGLDALSMLMKSHPVPVVMLSSLTQEGANETLKALELGAVDFVPKPSGSISLDIYKVQEQLIQKVKAAVKARINVTPFPPVSVQKSSSVLSNESLNQKLGKSLTTLPKQRDVSSIVLVGTSTGGPKALQMLLTSVPESLPAAILIVQHMPPGFTKSLSQRLDSLSSFRVVEAEDNMVLQNGVAYIAPGDYHMELKRDKHGNLITSLNTDPPRGGHRPSVDVLFESAAKVPHPSKYSVIMTGMGSDGTKGLESLKNTGCKEAIAEEESTCVVYGMPRAAIQSGKIDRILPLNEIGPYLVKALSN